MPPMLALIRTEGIPRALFDEMIHDIEAPDLDFIQEEIPDGAFAALEWSIPTAIGFFIISSYFDGFIKEMGKEHYQSVKKGLFSLKSKLFGPGRLIRTVAIGTPGKVDPDYPFSRTFSITAVSRDGKQVKLLIRDSASEEEYCMTVEQFLDMVERFYLGDGSDQLSQKLEEFPRSQMLVAYYNEETRKVVVVEPMKEFEQKRKA